MMTASNNGAAPPTTNIKRQLQPSCALRDKMADSAPPNGMPAMTRVTALTLPLARVDSDDKEMKLGIAPPSPRPVNSLAAVSDSAPLAIAVSNEKIPNKSSEP